MLSLSGDKATGDAKLLAFETTGVELPKLVVERKSREIIPSQLAVCSKPGRKHTYKSGKLLVNEDSWGYFTMQIATPKGGRAFPASSESHADAKESFFAFYIADGKFL